MKDLRVLVSAFVKTNRPKKWWVSVVVSPFDGEPSAYCTTTTKHALRVELDAYVQRASLCLRGESETLDVSKKDTYDAMLARVEKKTKVRYRLDRAYVAGSPVQLKKAVRDWLANVRPIERPKTAFESIAAEHADAKTVARWCRVLEGGAGYGTELDDAVMRKLLESPELVESARTFLAGLTDVPQLASKKAYKRAVRLMVLLVRDGDPKSVKIAKAFLARAKKTGDAVCYEVAMKQAR